MFDLQVAFFKPLWIRLAVVAVCLGWAAVEFWTGSTGWALMFGGVGLWSAYEFFVVFNPKDDDKIAKDDT